MVLLNSIAMDFIDSLPVHAYGTRYEPDAENPDHRVFAVDIYGDDDYRRLVIKFTDDGMEPLCLIYVVDGKLKLADYIMDMWKDGGSWKVILEDMGGYKIQYMEEIEFVRDN